MAQFDVFLSYSSKNLNIMQQVYKDLTAAGFRVWIDKTGIPVGSPSWRLAIQDGIESSQCLVVILSPDAKASKWVNEELSYAQTHDRQVFAIFALGNEKTAIPFGFSANQWVDIRQSYDILPLIGQLNKYLGRQTTSYQSPKPVAKKSVTKQPSQTETKATPQPKRNLEQTKSPETPIPKLHAWNPIDWFKLLLWVFIQPAKYKTYKRQHGEPNHVGGWIGSTLIAMVSIILTVGAIQEPKLIADLGSELTKPFIVPSPQSWLQVILGVWILAGLSSLLRLRIFLLFGIFTATVQLLVIILFLEGFYGATIFGTTLGFSLMPVYFAGYDGDRVEEIITITLVILLSLYISLTMNNIIEYAILRSAGLRISSSIMSSIGVIIGLIITVPLSVLFSLIMFYNWTAGDSGKALFTTLIASYAALIWTFWFGGWQVLA